MIISILSVSFEIIIEICLEGCLKDAGQFLVVKAGQSLANILCYLLVYDYQE